MKDIRLYIGDTLVQFTTAPDILFNFQLDNIQDPTIVRNSYSKQITVEGTRSNNDLFGDIWQLDRATLTGGNADTGIYFNASKRVPFQLFNNGEIYVEGYCKLDKIERKGQKITYTISLYGGVGEFFYNLMYSDTNDVGENNKKTLGDLDYGYDLGFTINKSTVQEAWSALTSSADSKWHTINFAPAYNGKPDNFSADKAVINCRGTLPFSTSITSGSTTYGAYGGYALASLPSEYTDAETRDLRSYLQRPVIRMKSIIDACCNPANNGGYNVVLDDAFFTSGNPYYNDTWMTLPMLGEYEYIAGSEITDYSPTITVTRGTPSTSSLVYTINGVNRQGLKKATLSFAPTLEITGSSYETLYSCQIVNWEKGGYWADIFTYIGKESGVMQILGGISVQAVAYLNGKEVCSSDYYVFDSRVEGKYYVSGNRRGKKPQYIFGTWKKQSGTSNYVFYGEDGTAKAVDLTLELNSRAYDTIKVVVESLCNDSSQGMRLFDATKYSVEGSKSDNCRFTNIFGNHYDDPQFAFISGEESQYASLSNRKFTQQMLLDTDGTPADYLLSYAKMFGLYFIKEPNERTIKIYTRARFYHRSNTRLKDINSLIDRSQPINITPVTMSTKWYDWKQEIVEGKYAEAYQKTTSMDYGMKRVNTGYEFDANSKNLYNGNMFKGAVEALEKSRMFSYCPSGETTDIKQWMVDGFDLTLYAPNNIEDTIESGYTALRGLQPINKANYKFYDLFPKAQFRDADNNSVDGRNVLLFYLGQVSAVSQYNNGVNLKYWLTDDLNMMLQLNDESPCWLYTVSSADTSGAIIALPVDNIPRFGRYSGDENEIIQWSLDFGEPRELYVPTYQTREESTIYYNYWKSYIEDLFDVDNKKVECYVFLNGFRPDEDLLRYFYFFDNAIWRINKITDWNLVKEGTTKVEFIKVKDKANYKSLAFAGNHRIILTANKSTLPQSGGSVTFTVVCTDQDMAWEGYDNWFAINGSVPYGTGNGTFTVEFPALTKKDTTFNLSLYNDEYNVISNSVGIVQIGIELGLYWWQQTQTIAATGGTYTLVAKSTYDWRIDRISCSSDNQALPVLSPMSGTSGNTFVTAVFDQDIAVYPRSYYVDLKDTYNNSYRRTISREGISHIWLPYSGGSVTVLSNPNAIWYGASDNWFTLTGTHSSATTISAEQNPDPDNERTGLVIYFELLTLKVVYIHQRKQETINVIPGTLYLEPESGSTGTLTISANTSWDITTE